MATKNDRWSAVDRYLEERLLGADEVLAAVLEDIRAHHLPAISVSPSQGKLLFVLARAMGARRILELGTLGGYSGIWLARALPPDGRLVTIEVEPTHAEVARRSFERAGVSRLVDLRVGSALTALPRIEADGTGPFDFIFIDADKPAYTEYLDWAIRLCRSGGLILADNVVRNGEVTEATSVDVAVVGVRRFMAAVETDRRVSATAIQTVGVKGYDGFALMVVN
jgi:predicted O-methyltransferase YrrM